MIPESLKQQIDQWLDGELPAEDEPHLQRVLQSTPEVLAYFSDRALLHGMLSKSTTLSEKCPYTLGDNPSLPVSSRYVPRQATPWIARPWVWVASTLAACLLLIPVLFDSALVASPTELVRKTLAEYQSSIDRCYAVKIDVDAPRRRRGLSRRGPPAESKLWVREDCFVQLFDAEGEQLVWGRNSAGAVWFTIASRSAAIFEGHEVPEALKDICDLRTLHLPNLLESLLRDYVLEFSSQEHGIHKIYAKPRPGNSYARYGFVEIEIEQDSLLVRRVMLTKLKDNRPLAVVIFELEQVVSRQPSQYDFSAYLQAGAEVLDRETMRGKRSELLREFLQKLHFPSVDRQDSFLKDSL